MYEQYTDEQIVEMLVPKLNKATKWCDWRGIIKYPECNENLIKAIATIQQGRYVESGRFLGWINRIAHNLIIDHFRREKNENTFSTDGLEYDYVNNSKHSEKSVEDVLSNEQVLRDVVHLVEFLPDSQKEVVKMRYFEELSFKEIAERTEVSINTALGRMRYALMNMRRMATEKNIYLEIK